MRKLACKLFIVIAWASVTFGQTAHYQSPSHAVLPDPQVTPGVVRTTNAAEICSPKFRTKPFRHTTAAMKNQVYKEYGVQRNKGMCAGGCEVDHLIPLELGGMDDVKNLWPQPSQPKPAFHEKDKLENWLKVEVCTNKMSLSDAQYAISTDWFSAYQAAHLQ